MLFEGERMKTYKLAQIEKYLGALKDTATTRRKTTPDLPKTPYENYSKGYLDALESIIKDLERILE